MTIQLDDIGAVVGILVGLLTLGAGLFAMLRYIIRAETSELRPNGGGSIKDAIKRIDERSEKTHTKLEQHMADSRARVERSDKVEAELRAAIKGLAEAIPIVAESTPPSGGK